MRLISLKGENFFAQTLERGVEDRLRVDFAKSWGCFLQNDREWHNLDHPPGRSDDREK